MGFDVIASVDWNAYGATALTIAKTALGLGFVIFVHELGHFLVAKMCGVKCEKFYIGFDIPMPFGIPSSLWRYQWGETEYGIGILPLGGYVKMLGQDDNPMNAEEEAQRTRLPNEGEIAESAGTRTIVLDPRSYTAKPVWKRMLIISAGVVMNLIFAVIFAAFAYRSGVPYTPCEIGQVVPGGPAWKAGVEPNTRIIQIGQDGKKRPNLRFDFDLRQSVYTHGDSSNLALLLRDAGNQEQWMQVRPFTFRRGWESSSTIGIVPRNTLTLSPIMPAQEGSAAGLAQPSLAGGDTIVAVDGQSLGDGLELIQYLTAHPGEPIKLRVERANKDKKGQVATFVDVEVGPQRLKDLGLVMQYSGVTAIRPDSPAARAGFQEGDYIEAVNGAPVVDGMLLPDMLRPYYGQEVTITVKRAGSSSSTDLKVQLDYPKSFDWMLPYGSSMASDALGVAYEVSRQVKQVLPDSPAAKAGFRTGDEITKIKIAWDADHQDRQDRPHDKAQELDDRQFTWPSCFFALQQLVPGEVVELSFDRHGQESTITLAPTEIDAYNPDRGLQFETVSEIHQVSSWKDAAFLGARQTWEDAFRVVDFLKKLMTGRISVANLGGIGSIAYVAGSEASQGTSRLLIFLTMLSANLAVLNFMPIPALDGGHMMFLMYEGVFRRPVNERLQVALTIAGFACLLGLIIFVNAMDVHRFLFS